MKYSLLDMTQTILSSMSGEEVNSISDTTESRQVAEIIRTAYFNIIARTNLPEHRELVQLVASTDADSPVLMLRPDNVGRIDWIKYNKSITEEPEINTEPQFEYVTILPLEQFLDMVHRFDIEQDNVDSFTLNDNRFYFANDAHPMYCTVVGDYYFVFDSYNSEFDTTLQSSKTLCAAEILPSFEMDNSFVPDLDTQQFPLLLNEAKSLAFFELKQMPHEKAEQESRRQWRTLQRVKHVNRPSDFDKLPNFGRNV